MKIIAIGDIVSKAGCEYAGENIFALKREYGADIVIANGENAATGNGILPQSADFLFNSGVDVITLGNHALKRPEISDYLYENQFIIRPANFHPDAPGKGSVILDKGAVKVAVINLQGTAFLDNNENPFAAADREIKAVKEQGANIIVIDFHAEATAEKRALGFYLDGQISVLFGTHTHVQTSDEQILPNGTGYITDLGMTGPYYSVLGVVPALAINKMKTNLPVRFKTAEGPCVLEGCFFETDNKTGKTVRIERFRK